ncbi:MAG: pyridoxamine 5'-phosphate oxidase family protein [Pseudonocardia sp.]|nr:pyridoxamine 5'-phosphate oxidase family protein [Pseudonocardia sp.]
MRDRLLPAMIEFVARMEMAFVATSDSGGDCDSSLRSGPPGFIQVLDERHLAYPEYRGNGVHASLGNISENPHVGLLMVDFERDLIGLHVNGRARVVADAELRAIHPALPSESAPGRRPERWVVVEVQEAYIHCRKHIPRMQRVHERRDWGTDDPARKGGDYFGAKAERAARDDRPEGQNGGPRVDGRPRGQDDSRAPAPVEPPGPKPSPKRRWWPFPSTTHMPTGSTTARPLRTARPPDTEPQSHGRIRWLSS